MRELCEIFNLSRQGHDGQWARAPRQALEVEMVAQLVMERRRRMPRLGGRKLYYLLRADFERMGLKLGRDRFFDLLRSEGLLVEPRRKSKRTTNSGHWLRVYPNRIAGLDVVRPDQVWVADLTYLRCEEGFVYLFEVTDLYSRKIVGWALSRTLEAHGALEALRRALAGSASPRGLIHHSDRGVQYCCGDYVDVLKKNEAAISMAEAGNPYENAVAERVHGILKGEFYLDRTFGDWTAARRAAAEAIEIYNNERPHLSLAMMTPSRKYEEGKRLAA